MALQRLGSNPFGLMMDPQAIFAAMERSERLESLQRHVYHPLDRPLAPKAAVGDVDAFDREVDRDATDD